MPNISRRNFLKTSSAAGLSAALINPASSFAKQGRKTRVIVVKDEDCLNSSNSPIEEKIQDMVDFGVMHLANIPERGLAYESMFSDTIESDTGIVLKKNDISGDRTINDMTVDCIEKGLTNMLDGNYNDSNVVVQNRNEDASGRIGQNDYIINCPVAWCHGSSYGVTLSLKNTMGYLDSPNRVHSTNKRWLHENSQHSSIESKQMFGIMDAIEGNNKDGPGSSRTFIAHTLILSTDIVAVDSLTIELMGDQSGASSSRLNTGKSQLDAAKDAGLGTNDQSEMEIIEIEPPFELPVGINEYLKPVKHVNNVQVINMRNRVEFSIPSANNAQITVFDLKGKRIWQASNITTELVTWNNTNSQGAKVPAGIYTYQINHKGATSQGTVTIAR